jgi:AraC family transcriptional regulator
VSDFTDIPEGMTTITQPAHTYAVFTHKGPQSEFEKTVIQSRETLKHAGYKMDTDAFWLEHYDQRFNPGSEQSECDIYYPIKR